MKTPEEISEDAYYMQVVENSHFWTNLDMLLQFLHNADFMTRSTEEKALIEYLKIGLNNTKKQGYDLVKLTDI